MKAPLATPIKLEQILALSGDKSTIGSARSFRALFIEAQIIEQGKADKVLIFKKKRRHNYRRKNGHRQRFTALHILSVSLNGTVGVKVEPRKIKEAKAAAVRIACRKKNSGP